MSSATEGEVRNEDPLIYSPSKGRAAVLTGRDDDSLEVVGVLGMRRALGKLVSRRSSRGIKPLRRGGPS